MDALLNEIAIPRAEDLLKKLTAELNSQDMLEEIFIETVNFKGTYEENCNEAASGKFSNAKDFLGLLVKDQAFKKFDIRPHLEKVARKMAILKA